MLVFTLNSFCYPSVFVFFFILIEKNVYGYAGYSDTEPLVGTNLIIYLFENVIFFYKLLNSVI